MIDRTCSWCTRTSQQTRVRCIGRNRATGRACGAERVLELSAHCQVCGSFDAERVKATPGDIPGILAKLTLAIDDLVEVDDSAEARELVTALARVTQRHQRATRVREVPSE